MVALATVLTPCKKATKKTQPYNFLHCMPIDFATADLRRGGLIRLRRLFVIVLSLRPCEGCVIVLGGSRPSRRGGGQSSYFGSGSRLDGQKPEAQRAESRVELLGMGQPAAKWVSPGR